MHIAVKYLKAVFRHASSFLNSKRNADLGRLSSRLELTSGDCPIRWGQLMKRTHMFRIRHFLFGLTFCLCMSLTVGNAQIRKVRVAMPGYTIAGISFLTAKLNGYYAGEGLDAELIAMRAPTANLALLSGSV